MKTSYHIKVNAYRDGKVYQEYIVKFIVFPSPPFEEDKRPILEVEMTDNILESISGTSQLMSDICKFINKVAPHFEAKVV